MVLKFDEATGEPYIQLPAPHNSIRLTPPRLTDAPANTAIMRDPAIYFNLIGPPFPFHEQDAIDFITSVQAWTTPVVEELERVRAENGGELSDDWVAAACPFKAIREMKEDGTDVYIGDLMMARSGYEDLGVAPDDPERKRTTEENMARPKGDPEIVWTIGGTYCSLLIPCTWKFQLEPLHQTALPRRTTAVE